LQAAKSRGLRERDSLKGYSVEADKRNQVMLGKEENLRLWSYSLASEILRFAQNDNTS
jgi:hypothetical protein